MNNNNTFSQMNKEIFLEQAKEYYGNNKERLQEQIQNKY